MSPESQSLRFHFGTRLPDGELLDVDREYLPGMRPVLFKFYKELPTVPLELEKPADEPSALSAIGNFADGVTVPDLRILVRVLHYSAGITKRMWGIDFRAAACTGALYHIELYVICGDLDGLEAGVYHYDPKGSRLHLLRGGDRRAQLAESCGGNKEILQAPATIVYTDIYWRNAIKYQARAFQHSFWDAGVIVANTFSIARSLGLGATLVMGFADPEISRLLGLDPVEELPVAIVPLGSGEPASARSGPEADEIFPDWEPKTAGSREFPKILRIHEQTSLSDPNDVRAWLQHGLVEAATGEAQVPDVSLHPLAESEQPGESLERVIIRRGSSRAFLRTPISMDQFSTMLNRAIRPIPTDYERAATPMRPHLIVHAVDGIEPGVYQVLGTRAQLGLSTVKLGQFRPAAQRLAVGQSLGGDSAANIYYLADLERVLEAYGERGYRLAQMEAAISAGWGYLAAYALGIGATGLTFYENEVKEFLGVGLNVMFQLAVGVPGKRPN